MLQLEGTVIGGDFRVLRPLASGGMGGVYVAEQLSTGQQRALKIMHATLVANPRMRERFAQEARVGAQVQSQHVVQVIGAGVDPQHGVPWLAMELLHGEDLGHLAARRRVLPLTEVVPIFRQLCHALGAAHDAGIVHRDIKPENIFLANVQSSDSSLQVKVLDFGIAKLVADAQQSATGQIGTPLWMAPEQSDQHQHITPAADVWALGLLAFRLLTGKFYWRVANEESGPLSALFRETIMDPIIRASERAREYGVDAALPAGFDAWFAHCVARDPSQRFQNARDTFAALEALAPDATRPLTYAATAGAVAPAAVAAYPTPVSPQLAANTYSGSHGMAVTRPGRSGSPLALVLGGAVLLVGVGVVIALGAGAFFFRGELETLAATSATPAPTPSATATTVPAETAEAPASATPETPGKPVTVARGSARTSSTAAATAKPDTQAAADAGAATASAEADKPKDPGLKPIDRAAVQAKVDATAAAAQSQCASQKAPENAVETYSGNAGFRPTGSTSNFMMGMGGAKPCVQSKMFGMSIGKYDHPESWHVETFKWSVTIK